MPELPEVETIRQDMLRKVKGKKIYKVEVKNEKPIRIPTPSQFIQRLEGKVFKDILRRGKYLIVQINSTQNLIFHLKLTGRLIFSPQGEKTPKYTRIIFNFEDKSKLFFTDIRGFADVYLISEKEWDKIPSLRDIGPEPLDPDFTLNKFENILRGKRGKIKPLLMNQSFIAGIGNVYSQEALFRARIHPERNSSQLKKEEVESLYKNLLSILREAISYRGSSVDAYVDLQGEKGKFESHLQVYGRKGKSCERCGKPIVRKMVGGRGTYFCPNCQK
ncbi:DNA-formamidopyrimidine glycosylase [Candidatus Aerophobetes bacterium]|nr:DNA-formamidopyrimidine glycosylase [Candidatus Aerophobetes bacterium]